jgi:hypothetical protein
MLLIAVPGNHDGGSSDAEYDGYTSPTLLRSGRPPLLIPTAVSVVLSIDLAVVQHRGSVGSALRTERASKTTSPEKKEKVPKLAETGPLPRVQLAATPFLCEGASRSQQ